MFPTITCESNGHFTCLNTYDRAALTFGHIQLAAHTPDDNFVVFFREILAHPAAAEYFPDLALSGGRIHVKTDADLSPLESAATTALLMDYFNPTPSEVDDIEADRSARLVDWCLRYRPRATCRCPFRCGNSSGSSRCMRPGWRWTASWISCASSCSTSSTRGAQSTRRSPPPWPPTIRSTRFVSIGASQYGDRIATLRAGIKDHEVREKVGRKVYDRDAGDFVVPSGA